MLKNFSIEIYTLCKHSKLGKENEHFCKTQGKQKKIEMNKDNERKKYLTYTKNVAS